MDSRAADLLAAGQAALKVADWSAARRYFTEALEHQENPAAHDGLGLALWWLNEIEPAHQHRTRAYLGFRQGGELGRAAFLAAWLAREQVFLHANVSAMHGWFARAERLLQEVEPSLYHAWFHLFRASLIAPPGELAQIAQQVVEAGRAYHDPDLEALALAFRGSARVALGQVGEGMVALDEAMIAATNGELENLATTSEIFCVMLSACELAGDLTRTTHWCQVITEFARRFQSVFLAAYCRTTYGGLLTATGRWSEAEGELVQAIRAFDTGHRGLRVHAALKLAELRIAQGRLEEAQALLSGYEDHGGAQVPLARLYLAQGDIALARAMLDRALHPPSPPTLHRAPALLVQIDVSLAMGDVATAHRTAGDLLALARETGSASLLAQATLAQAQVLRSTGDRSAAEVVQSALDLLQSVDRSILAGRARLEMARLLAERDRPGAVTWARAALASFERLGAIQDVNAAAQVLRQLGAARGPGLRQAGPLTQREEEVLALLAEGLTNHEIADRLFISAKTAEHHVGRILDKLGVRSRAEAAALVAGGRAPIVRHNPE